MTVDYIGENVIDWSVSLIIHNEQHEWTGAELMTPSVITSELRVAGCWRHSTASPESTLRSWRVEALYASASGSGFRTTQQPATRMYATGSEKNSIHEKKRNLNHLSIIWIELTNLTLNSTEMATRKHYINNIYTTTHEPVMLLISTIDQRSYIFKVTGYMMLSI